MVKLLLIERLHLAQIGFKFAMIYKIKYVLYLYHKHIRDPYRLLFDHLKTDDIIFNETPKALHERER